jgi:hypothetical protein
MQGRWTSLRENPQLRAPAYEFADDEPGAAFCNTIRSAT